MKCVLNTTSSEETEKIAETMGRNLRGGEVIELISDLGGGKTTFVRGLARGFGSTDRVASPTFTVSKLYKAGKRELHHFDFYRLPNAGVVAYELHDLLDDPDSAVVIEWAEAVSNVLPNDRVEITIERTGDHSRKLSVKVPENLKHVVENINTV